MTYAGAAFAALALAACSAADGVTVAVHALRHHGERVGLPDAGDRGQDRDDGGERRARGDRSHVELEKLLGLFARICPHQGSTINKSGNGFVCPNHGAAFNSSGQWTGGQRTSNLTSYPATYDATTGTLSIGS